LQAYRTKYIAHGCNCRIPVFANFTDEKTFPNVQISDYFTILLSLRAALAYTQRTSIVGPKASYHIFIPKWRPLNRAVWRMQQLSYMSLRQLYSGCRGVKLHRVHPSSSCKPFTTVVSGTFLH